MEQNGKRGQHDAARPQNPPHRPQRRRLLPHAAVGGGLAQVGVALQQAACHHDTSDAPHHLPPLLLPAQQPAQVVNKKLQAQRAALAVTHAQPRHKRHIPAVRTTLAAHVKAGE